MFFLQIDTTAVLDSLATNPSGTEQQALSLFDLLLKGGWIMIPIALLSVITIYIFIEKMMVIRAASKTPDSFMDQIKILVMNGDIMGARSLCARENTPIARMVEKGIARIGSPLKNIEASIENVGKIELYRLEKNISILATAAGAAPMIGFLGTVTGMIQAFMNIAQIRGQVTPSDLSTGIYEAMITTAAGLAVGLVAYLAYNYLVTRIQKVVHSMEYTSINFIDLLQEPNR
jgi:biopolymer transport protein ExbB